MSSTTWILFDLGNTLIRLDYERVLENIRRDARATRDELIQLLESPGAYRDMERGAVSFREFWELLRDSAGYRGTRDDLRVIWSDFFAGVVPGMEELLERLRKKYRIAFLSNSNEVHAEVIPRSFPELFERDDRFIFSHRFKVAKPDPELFRRALEVIGALPQHVVFVDDLAENVFAARSLGIPSFQFLDAERLEREMREAGLLSSDE